MTVCATGQKVSIRLTSSNDFDSFCNMQQSRLDDGDIIDIDFVRKLWRDRHIENNINFTIIENTSQEVCGFGSLQGINTTTPEIGIDIMVKFRMDT